MIILSDLVFNHSEHHKLLDTCRQSLKRNGGKCLVVFSPHRPHLLQDDLSFFETAKQYQFKTEKLKWSLGNQCLRKMKKQPILEPEYTHSFNAQMGIKGE